METIMGFVYLLGDDINTDDIVPSHTLTMRDPEEMASHTLEYVDSTFISKVKKSEIHILVGGENFGTGSSREEAVHVFKILGIKAIIAKSFARIYFRNLINLGIPAITLDWKEHQFSDGDQVEIDLEKGTITNKTNNLRFSFRKLPKFLTQIVEAGGIFNKIKEKLKP